MKLLFCRLKRLHSERVAVRVPKLRVNYMQLH